MTTEVKVGILFFAGLAVALFFTLFVSEIGSGPGAYSVRFPRISSVDVGAPVTYNGVQVGNVRQVQPVLEAGVPMVAITFDVNPENQQQVLIGDTTEFRIAQGFLGGATLEIINTGAGAPISNDVLQTKLGQPPVTMGEAIEQIADMVAENRANLKAAIDQLPDAVGNISGMSREIKETVAENRANISTAVVNIGDMAASIKTFVDDNRDATNLAINNVGAMAEEIRGTVAENREDIRATIAAFPETMENAKGATDELHGILADNRNDLRELIKGLRSFAPKLDQIGTDVSQITSQIASGRGTLGRLVYEDTLHDKTVSAVDTFEQRLEEVEPFTAGIADLKFYAGVRGGIDIDSGAGIGTGYIRIEPKPWKFYEVGVGYRTAPDDRNTVQEDPDDFNVDIDFTLGWRFFPDNDSQIYRLSVRGGLIEGAFGGQVDVNLWQDRIWGSIMARNRHNDYEPNERRYEEGSGAVVRATLNYRVWKRITIEAGLNDVLDDPSPWVGMSAELLDNDFRNLVTAAGVVPGGL